MSHAMDVESGRGEWFRAAPQSLSIFGETVDISAASENGVGPLYTLSLVRGAIVRRYLHYIAQRHWVRDRLPDECSPDEDDPVLEDMIRTPPTELLNASHMSVVVGLPGHGKSCFVRSLFLAGMRRFDDTYAGENIGRMVYSHTTETSPNIYLHSYRRSLPVIVHCHKLSWKSENKEWDDGVRECEEFSCRSLLEEICALCQRQIVDDSGDSCDRYSEVVKAALLGNSSPAGVEFQDVVLLVEGIDLVSLSHARAILRVLQHLRTHANHARTAGDAPAISRPRPCIGVVVVMRPRTLLTLLPTVDALDRATFHRTRPSVRPGAPTRNVLEGGLSNVSLGERHTGINILHLEPGPSFEICRIEDLPPPLKAWSMVKSCFDPSVMQSVSASVAFLDELRSARSKLYPVWSTEPLLLFLLARHLCKGRQSRDTSGDEASIEGALDAMAVEEGRDVQHNISLAEVLDGVFEDQVAEAMDTTIASAWSGAEALTRACTVFGFLVHWLAVHDAPIIPPQELGHAFPDADEHGGLASPGGSGSKNMRKGAARWLALKHEPSASVSLVTVSSWFETLMEDESTAFLLGYRAQPGATDVGKSIVAMIISVLSMHYTRCADDRVLVNHPALSEHLASRFLADPMDMLSSVLSSLKKSSVTPRVSFSFAAAYCFTDPRWDYVLHFCGLRNGVQWLYERIIHPRLHDTTEQWLSQLAITHGDCEDYGQLRFHVLLRLYAAISMHRSTHKTQADPLTKSFSATMVRLLHHSHSGALGHINAFPVYHLACFHNHSARGLVEKCLDPFLNRCTSQALQLLTRLHRCPLMHTHSRQLTDNLEMGETRRRLSVVRLIGQVDKWKLHREQLMVVVNALLDPGGMVRSEAVSIVHGIGMDATSFFSPRVLGKLFLDGNPEPVISSAIQLLTRMVEGSATMAPIGESKAVGQYHEQLGDVVELLSQADPGARALGFLVLHNPRVLDFFARLYGHNPLQRSEVRNFNATTKALRGAQLIVHTALREALGEESSLDGAGEESGKPSSMESFVGAGGGSFTLTVGLSSLIVETLGEKASCWVSAFPELLQQNEALMSQMMSSLFVQLSTEKQRSVLEGFLDSSGKVDGTALYVVLLSIRMIRACPVAVRLPHLRYLFDIGSCASRQLEVRMEALEVYRDTVLLAPQALENHNGIEALLDIVTTRGVNAPVYMLCVTLLEQCASTPGRQLPELADRVHRILFAHASHHYTQLLAAIALFRYRLDVTPDSASWPVLVEVLNNPHAEVRSSAARALAALWGTSIEGLPATPVPPILVVLSSLFKSPQWYVRSASTSTMCMLARCRLENLAPRCALVAHAVHHAMVSFPDSRSVTALREHVPQSVQQRVGEVLMETRDFGLQAGALDALGSFGEFSLVHFQKLVQKLGAPDLEVRHAAGNCLAALRPYITKGSRSKFGAIWRCVDTLLEMTRNATVLKTLKEYAKSSHAHRRSAVLAALDVFGPRSMVENYDMVLSFLQDKILAIITDTMKVLRACFTDTAVEARMLFGRVVVKLMSHSVPRIRAGAMRLTRCDPTFAAEVRPLVVGLFVQRGQHIKVRIQALRVICMTGPIPPECAPALINLLRVTETRLLGSITVSLTDGKENSALIVPKLINEMDHRELNGIKRKLCRFMHMYPKELAEHTQDLLPAVMHMASADDSMVRRKAVEMLGLLSVSLDTNPDTMYVNQAWDFVVRGLCSTLADRNSLVRKAGANVLGYIGARNRHLIQAIMERIMPRGKPPHHYSISIWRGLCFHWGIVIGVSHS